MATDLRGQGKAGRVVERIISGGGIKMHKPIDLKLISSSHWKGWEEFGICQMCIHPCKFYHSRKLMLPKQHLDCPLTMLMEDKDA